MSESIITVKNRHFGASIEALNALGKIPEGALDPMKIQKLSRWLRKIQNALEDYQKGERALYLAHWKNGEDGEKLPSFQPEHPGIFAAAQMDYADATTEIRVPRLPLSWFDGKAKLTAGQIASLDWWLDIPEDDTP